MKHNRFFVIGLIVLVAVLGSLSGAALAQDMPPLPGELVIGDLQTPRGISFDESGNLIVTVVGNGGEMSVEMPAIEDPTAMMTVNMGLSGAILSVGADGAVAPVLGGFPSYATPSETLGLYRAIQHNGSWWIVYSAAGPGAYWGSTIAQLDANGMTQRVIPFYPYEAENNPDGNEIDSNISDVAWHDGVMYITDAGGNSLLSWTEADGVQPVVSWPSNDVPTSVEISEDGDIFVGFLGAGLAPGAGKVEMWSDGELVQTWGGLTTVTDILFDGENLYAVEMFLFGETGPGAGDVVMLNEDGSSTVVAGGLITPFGLAQDADGALYVSFGTIAMGPGMTGGVVKLPSM